MSFLESIFGPNKQTIAAWKHQATEKAQQRMTVELVHFIERNSLSCGKCSKLAVPIFGAKNRYRCDGCGRQFAAARHGADHEGLKSYSLDIMFAVCKDIAGSHASSCYFHETLSDVLWKAYSQSSIKFSKKK